MNSTNIKATCDLMRVRLFSVNIEKKASHLELAYNCLKVLERVEAPPSSTNPPGCSLVIEFGNHVHGHYTVNSTHSPAANCLVGKKFCKFWRYHVQS